MSEERRQSIIERILLRTEDKDTGYTTPCVLWTGPDSGSGRGGGYGRMSLNGQTVAVHLVVYTHYYGYIPGNRQVDHLCNQRLCCNPAHLELVSHKTNQQRRVIRNSYFGNFEVAMQ